MLHGNELMRTYCTLSDKNYLIKGLALIDSLLEKSSEELIIYYLCMDKETYNKIISLNDKKIVPINIIALEKEKDFKILKENTKYNTEWCSYCFALGSYFTEYIIRIYNVKDILYVDSDIIFYQDPKFIFEEISEKSIGIMLHRHVPIGHGVGGYNVGIVYFKNNNIGYKCLKWWRDCVMDPTNQWHARYGKVGDQVYLEAFEPLFGSDNISIIDKSIGHGAPWNFTLYQYDNEDIIWRGNRQKMIFIHFSHFTPNYDDNTYSVDKDGEWHNPQRYHNRIQQYYDDYFISLNNTRIKYNL